MGHLNPSADWDHIGALDEARVQIHSKGWMLPSSHLIIHESPKDAASRIAREQLNVENLLLSEPKVVSEVYAPERFQNLSGHWDIEFIFFAAVEKTALGKPSAWIELQFIDPSTTVKSEFARSHEDVLQSAGFRIQAQPKLIN
jgi:ADP-ribose pyrophosphatase YjhB (NUDIX family)